MWWLIPIIGLLLGIYSGQLLQIEIPVGMVKYLSISIMAALDSVFGGIRSLYEKKFDGLLMLTGFFANAMLAAGLTFMGDMLGVDLYLAAVFAFGVRLFSNLSAIRHSIVRNFRDRRRQRQQQREWEETQAQIYKYLESEYKDSDDDESQGESESESEGESESEECVEDKGGGHENEADKHDEEDMPPDAASGSPPHAPEEAATDTMQELIPDGTVETADNPAPRFDEDKYEEIPPADIPAEHKSPQG